MGKLNKVKGVAVALTIATIVSGGGINVLAEPYNMSVDNIKYNQVNIIEKNNTVYVPLRGVAEALKYKVDWNKGKGTVQISKGTKEMEVTNGKDTMEIKELSNGLKVKTELGGKVEIVKGTTMVPVNLLDILGVGYDKNEGQSKFNIYTKFMVADVGQETKYSGKIASSRDQARLNQLTQEFGVKNGIRVEKSDYLESRSIEDLYEYVSEIPTQEELSNEYLWGDFLSEGVNVNTVTKLSRLKTLAPMAGISMEFEATEFHNIGGQVHLIGGYVDYKGGSIGINQAYKNYVENYEKTTWKLMKDSDKAFIRSEIAKMLTEINKENKMVLFLIQDGSVVYMD